METKLIWSLTALVEVYRHWYSLSPRSVGLNRSDMFIHSLPQFVFRLPNILGSTLETDDKIYHIVCVARCMASHPFLALLSRIAIRRGYALPNFCVVRLRSHSSRRRRKLLVQMLSPLRFMDRLASNFM